ncbi:MAG: YebB family permuted papain-like enzyme [Lentisphaeraceae bacterium]|nr:YebB family permuted papain-like enzyme [Lentisphaeraceae bacterium]
MIEQINNIVKPGDIVFISIPNFLFRRVATTTCSWTSHVGVIHSKVDGQWIVAEGAVPLSKKCTLEKFIQRSENSAISIRRLKEDLSSDEVLRIQKAADQRMNKLYHLGFNYNSKRQYCSKFVYEVFNEALGIEVGELETFKELLNKNPQLSKTFWKIWFFGFIPWKRKTVTPASQYESLKLTTVFENI